MVNGLNILAGFQRVLFVEQVAVKPFHIFSERLDSIKNPYFIAVFYKFVDNVASDKARTASYQYFQYAPLIAKLGLL
jgi:hypothetical protein